MSVTPDAVLWFAANPALNLDYSSVSVAKDSKL